MLTTRFGCYICCVGTFCSCAVESWLVYQVFTEKTGDMSTYGECRGGDWFVSFSAYFGSDQSVFHDHSLSVADSWWGSKLFWAA